MRSATAPAPSPASSPWPSSTTATDAASSTTPDPAGFGVYVHWPFCASKCPYCDFNSHVRSGGVDEAAFLAAFLREIETTADAIGPRVAASVFFGGGTPSLMAPATVARILAAIDHHFPLERGAEITLEANPSSVEADRFAGYRAAGVNRVSLGVQALRDADLKALGRLHLVSEAKAALEIASRTFERVSFDLIYARQGQTVAAWEGELGEALSLAPAGHLSLYQLTIEPNTTFEALFRAGKLRIPDPELADEMFALTQAMTAAAGLPAYEISNHARAGEESRHNLLYWRYGEYAGIGPGAHGRLVRDGSRHATTTERQPERWLERVMRDGHGRTEDEPLDPAACVDEALLMGLRLAEGLPLERLVRLGGARPADGAIADLVDLDLLEALEGGRRLRATPRGRFVLNEIVLQLSRALSPVPPEPQAPS